MDTIRTEQLPCLSFLDRLGVSSLGKKTYNGPYGIFFLSETAHIGNPVNDVLCLGLQIMSFRRGHRRSFAWTAPISAVDAHACWRLLQIIRLIL